MADSGITKKALAEALKQLMEEMPFAKISVADICEHCDMNRKSFYYHFKDKYDLLNWILDTELLEMTLHGDAGLNFWEKIRSLLCYLYDNQSFVRKALDVEGQNSPAEHFRVMLHPVLNARMKEIFGDDQDHEFQADFFCDALRYTIERWIRQPNCVPPDVFFTKLVDTIRSSAEYINRSFEENNNT